MHPTSRFSRGSKSRKPDCAEIRHKVPFSKRQVIHNACRNLDNEGKEMTRIEIIKSMTAYQMAYAIFGAALRRHLIFARAGRLVIIYWIKENWKIPCAECAWQNGLRSCLTCMKRICMGKYTRNLN